MKMKKLITLFLLLCAYGTQAQNFEGTIKYSMKMEITDPAMKAKMDEAQQKLADPATQAKMKAMEAKMNDPQFKALMENNPQMKAQMEAMMKRPQGGDAGSMMPSGFIFKIKGDNTLMKMEGGMMAMEVLYLKDKDQSYNLNRERKTYMVLPSGNQGKESTAAKPKVTKTSETTKILGYNCTKYIVESTEMGKTVTSFIWTTTEIKDIDAKTLGRGRVGRGQSFYYEGMTGVPLRMQATMEQGKMTMEVTEFKKETLSADDFTIPTGFTETKGMF